MTFPRESPQVGARHASPVRVAALVIAAAALGSACRQDMHDAPRYEVYEASELYPDGRSSRATPPGTVPRGWLRDNEALETGKVNGENVAVIPFAISHADLQRGRERYGIFCTPCHSELGDGNGMVVQRGLRQAANFHQDRLRQENIGYFYDVITNGFGAMQGYSEQVPVRDRWLIAAYVRALQYSQNAAVGDVPAERRAQLESGTAPERAPDRPAGTDPPPGGTGRQDGRPRGVGR